MSDFSVKDTAAWRVVRQLIDHGWGQDEKLEDHEFLDLCSEFHQCGGSWEALMKGDSSCVEILENSIQFLFEERRIASIAAKISN